jgi:hypothetical protein
MTPRNNDLKPTVITDRNGKVTTVHKKDQRAFVPSRPMPSPSIISGNQSASLERTLTLAAKRKCKDGPRNKESLEALHNLLADPETGEAGWQQQGFLALLDNRQTEVVIGAMSKEGFPDALNLMHNVYSTGQIVGFASLYEEDLFVPPSKAASSEVDKARINMQLWGSAHDQLRKLDLLDANYDAYSDLSTLDSSGKEQVSTFLRLYGAVKELGHKGKMPQDLIDFALSNSHDINDVVSAMRSTRSMDPIFLRGVLDGIEAPVAGGWL